MTDSTTCESLATALPKEMARVRDELMPIYQAIGQPGVFAMTLMAVSLDEAANALASGDVVRMIRAYADLKGFKE